MLKLAPTLEDLDIEYEGLEFNLVPQMLVVAGRDMPKLHAAQSDPKLAMLCSSETETARWRLRS